MKTKCTAVAGPFPARGVVCDREIRHPGLHWDKGLHTYWMHGAPKLETVELPERTFDLLDPDERES